ncbi:MAG: 3-hydroxyacyl-CoA dehydrogenase family protein, partial [Rhodococcus sp. (in: high G+C Gram-positive bacteria)]
MGAGIAQVFAALGSTVVVAEAADQEAALGRVSTGLDRAHERGKLTERPGDILARVTTVAGPAELPADLALVVEAVPEIPSLKVEVLALIDKAVSDSTVIASNTSSISIAELGAALQDPSRFIGMHFFNPVPVSTLVEIVRAPATSPAVVEQVRNWVSLMGKTEVLVNDSPGFATSRLGVCLGLEAIRM